MTNQLTGNFKPTNHIPKQRRRCWSRTCQQERWLQCQSLRPVCCPASASQSTVLYVRRKDAHRNTNSIPDRWSFSSVRTREVFLHTRYNDVINMSVLYHTVHEITNKQHRDLTTRKSKRIDQRKYWGRGYREGKDWHCVQ